MDILKIKKYVHPEQSRTRDLTNDGKGNKHGHRFNTNRPFYEFYINGRRFSDVLTEFCQLHHPLLDDWIGLLGAFDNNEADQQMINRLLGETEPLTESEVKEIARMNKKIIKTWFPEGLNKKKRAAIEMEGLAENEVMLYGCSVCGDEDCGGYKIKVTFKGEKVRWTFEEKGRLLEFNFSKGPYAETFNSLDWNKTSLK